MPYLRQVLYPYNKIRIIKPTRWTNFSNSFLEIKLYMFRTVPLSIIMSVSLYTQQWYMPYSLRAGSGRNCRSVLISLASCQHVCMTYTIAMCTEKTCWWWTEELSETCRILFLKYIWEISVSSWFYYKNLSRWTVSWKSTKKERNALRIVVLSTDVHRGSYGALLNVNIFSCKFLLQGVV